MCGICGFVFPSGDSGRRSDLMSMMRTLVHRGPDDEGYVILCGTRMTVNGVDTTLAQSHPRVGLGHMRLSILDLSRAGRQPMSDDDRTLWISYNGEIYNYKSIRKELERKGHRFKSNTDTEVVLYAYKEWGRDCLHRFNGMFAFGIYDLRDQSLFLARDRLGIKPLYWIAHGGGLAFASELKALLQLPGIEIKANWNGLLGHLLFLWSPDPETAFEGIAKLPAGHFLYLRNGKLRVESYWNVEIDPDPRDRGEAEYTGQLGELLESSVKRRMVSDVPIGALLSGGLDSSLICAFMDRLGNGRTTAYTITFADQDKIHEAMPDDQLYARKVAAQLKLDHHEIELRPDIADLLPKIIWHLEEPIADPAAINTYMICKMAKERGTTVMLSGMGADEIFAGYRKHLSVYLAQLYKQFLPARLRDGFLRPMIDQLPVAGKKGGYRLIRWGKRFAKSASLEDLDCFVGNSSYYDSTELNALLNPDLQIDWKNAYPIRRHYEHHREVESLDLISRMTYLDTKMFLPSLNLSYTDKASMAASVEERVPFVDHEVVTFALNLPARYRIHRLTQKYLLKKVASDYFPSEIIRRPKAPFGAPLRSWMHRDLRSLVDDVLSESSIRKRGYFRYNAVRKMVHENSTGQQDYSHRLWGLVVIELWHRMFIDDRFQLPTLSS